VLASKERKIEVASNIVVLPSFGEKGAIERERALFRLWSVSMREGSKFRVLVLREREKDSGFVFWI